MFEFWCLMSVVGHTFLFKFILLLFLVYVALRNRLCICLPGWLFMSLCALFCLCFGGLCVCVGTWLTGFAYSVCLSACWPVPARLVVLCVFLYMFAFSRADLHSFSFFSCVWLSVCLFFCPRLFVPLSLCVGLRTCSPACFLCFCLPAWIFWLFSPTCVSDSLAACPPPVSVFMCLCYIQLCLCLCFFICLWLSAGVSQPAGMPTLLRVYVTVYLLLCWSLCLPEPAYVFVCVCLILTTILALKTRRTSVHTCIHPKTHISMHSYTHTPMLSHTHIPTHRHNHTHTHLRIFTADIDNIITTEIWTTKVFTYPHPH